MVPRVGEQEVEEGALAHLDDGRRVVGQRISSISIFGSWSDVQSFSVACSLTNHFYFTEQRLRDFRHVILNPGPPYLQAVCTNVHIHYIQCITLRNKTVYDCSNVACVDPVTSKRPA